MIIDGLWVNYSWFIIYNGSYNVMVDDENEQCGKPNAINLPFGDEIFPPIKMVSP